MLTPHQFRFLKRLAQHGAFRSHTHATHPIGERDVCYRFNELERGISISFVERMRKLKLVEDDPEGDLQLSQHGAQVLASHQSKE